MRKCTLLLIGLMATMSCFAAIVVPITRAGKTPELEQLGTITLQDSLYGLLIIPNLKGLPPGIHGFHLYSNPSCGDAGHAAGGIFDPKNTSKHLGPYNPNGMLGSLPALFVDKKGNAQLPLLAPRLNEETASGHTLIILASGDNYSDTPVKSGGDSTRIACGVVASKNVTPDPQLNSTPNSNKQETK